MEESSKKTVYLKQFAKTSFFVFFAIVISKALSYAYKILLVRFFDLEIYGLYSIALIIIGIFIGIGSLGLSDGLTRYLSQYYEKKDYINAKKLVRKAVMLSIASGVFFGIVLYSTSEVISKNLFHNLNLTYYLKLFSIAIPFAITANLLLATIRAKQKIKTYSFIVNISQNALRIAFVFILILMGLRQEAVPLSHLLSAIGLFLLATIFFIRNNSSKEEPTKNKESPIFKEVLIYSWPIAVVGLLYGLLYWVDSLVIGYYKDASLIGTYNVAITIISLFGIAPDLFIQLLFPFVSGKLAAKKGEIIKEVSTQIIKWVFLINIPLLFLLFAFPETIIKIIFGPASTSAAPALRILTISGIFTSFISIFTNLISAAGKTRVILYWFMAFTTINLALGIYLVPIFSLAGAAYATTISSTLFFIASFTYVKKQYSFYPINKSLLRFTIYCLLLITAFIFIGNYLDFASYFIQLTYFIVFILGYAFLVFYSKILNHDDIEIIKSIFNKILRR